MKLGAIILTGGASLRMGEDKASLEWLGRRAVDRVAQIANDLGAVALLTVGRRDYGLPFVEDAVPLGGPTGGILAGAAALADYRCDLLLVLAVDAPTLQSGDVEPLLLQGRPGAAYAGYNLPLVIAPNLISKDALADWPIGRLIDRCDLRRLDCPPHATSRIRGANTPEEREALLQALAAYEISAEWAGS